MTKTITKYKTTTKSYVFWFVTIAITIMSTIAFGIVQIMYFRNVDVGENFIKIGVIAGAFFAIVVFLEDWVA
jgi:hypothetical protein